MKFSTAAIKDIDKEVLQPLGKKNLLTKLAYKEWKSLVESLIDSAIQDMSGVDINKLTKVGEYQSTVTRNQISDMMTRINHLSSIKASLAITDITSKLHTDRASDDVYYDLIKSPDRAVLKDYFDSAAEYIREWKLGDLWAGWDVDATARYESIKWAIDRGIEAIGKSDIDSLSDDDYINIMKDLSYVYELIWPKVTGALKIKFNAIDTLSTVVNWVRSIFWGISMDEAIKYTRKRGDAMARAYESWSAMRREAEQRVNSEDVEWRGDDDWYVNNALLTSNLTNLFLSDSNRWVINEVVTKTIWDFWDGLLVNTDFLNTVKFSTTDIENTILKKVAGEDWVERFKTFDEFLSDYFGASIFKWSKELQNANTVDPSIARRFFDNLTNTSDHSFNEKSRDMMFQLENKYNIVGESYGGRWYDRNLRTKFHDVTWDVFTPGTFTTLEAKAIAEKKEFQSDYWKVSDFENYLLDSDVALDKIEYYTSNFNMPQYVGLQSARLSPLDNFKIMIGDGARVESDLWSKTYAKILSHINDVEKKSWSYYFGTASEWDNWLLVNKQAAKSSFISFLWKEWSKPFEALNQGAKDNIIKGYLMLKWLWFFKDWTKADLWRQKFAAEVAHPGTNLKELITGVGYNSYKYFPKMFNPNVKVGAEDLIKAYSWPQQYSGNKMILMPDFVALDSNGKVLHNEGTDSTVYIFGAKAELMGKLSNWQSLWRDYQSMKINHTYDWGIIKSKQQAIDAKGFASIMFNDWHAQQSFAAVIDWVVKTLADAPNVVTPFGRTVEEIFAKIWYDPESWFRADAMPALIQFFDHHINNGIIKEIWFQSAVKNFSKKIQTWKETVLKLGELWYEKPGTLVDINTTSVYGITNAKDRTSYDLDMQSFTQQIFQNQSYEWAKALAIALDQEIRWDHALSVTSMLEQAMTLIGNGDIAEANAIMKEIFDKWLDKESDIVMNTLKDYKWVDKITPTEFEWIFGTLLKNHSARKQIRGINTDMQSVGTWLFNRVMQQFWLWGDVDPHANENVIIMSRKHFGMQKKWVPDNVLDTNGAKIEWSINRSKDSWESGDTVFFTRHPNSAAKTARWVKVIFIEDIAWPERDAFMLWDHASNSMYLHGWQTNLSQADFDWDTAVIFPGLSRQVVDGKRFWDIAFENTLVMDNHAGETVDKSAMYMAENAYWKKNVDASRTSLGHIKTAISKSSVSSAATQARWVSTLLNADFMLFDFVNMKDFDPDVQTAMYQRVNPLLGEAIEAAVDGALGKKTEETMTGVYTSMLDLFPYWKARFESIKLVDGKLPDSAKPLVEEFIELIDANTLTNGIHEIQRNKENKRTAWLSVRTTWYKKSMTWLDTVAIHKLADWYLNTYHLKDMPTAKDASVIKLEVYRNYMLSKIKRYLADDMAEYKKLYMNKWVDLWAAKVWLEAYTTALSNAETAGDIRQATKDLVGSFKRWGKYIYDVPFMANYALEPAKDGKKNDQYNPFFARVERSAVLPKLKLEENQYNAMVDSVYSDSKIRATDWEKFASFLLMQHLNDRQRMYATLRSWLFMDKMWYKEAFSNAKKHWDWATIERYINRDKIQIISNSETKGQDALIKKFNEPTAFGWKKEKQAAIAYVSSFIGASNVWSKLGEYLADNHTKTYYKVVAFDMAPIKWGAMTNYLSNSIKDFVSKKEYNDLKKFATEDELNSLLIALTAGDGLKADKIKKSILDTSVDAIVNTDLSNSVIDGTHIFAVHAYREWIKRISVNPKIQKEVVGNTATDKSDVLIASFASDAHGSMLKQLNEMLLHHKNRADVNTNTMYTNAGYQLLNALSNYDVDSISKFNELMKADPMLQDSLTHIFSNVKDMDKYKSLSSQAKAMIIKEVALLVLKEQKATLLSRFNSNVKAKELLSVRWAKRKNKVSQLTAEIHKIEWSMGTLMWYEKSDQLFHSANKVRANITKSLYNDSWFKRQVMVNMGRIMREHPSLSPTVAHDRAVKDATVGNTTKRMNIDGSTVEEINNHVKEFQNDIGGILREHAAAVADVADKIGNHTEFLAESDDYHKKQFDDLLMKEALKNTTTSERWFDTVIWHMNNIYKSTALGIAWGRIIIEWANASISRIVNRTSTSRVLSKRSLIKELGIKWDLNLSKDKLFSKIVWSHREELKSKVFKEFHKLPTDWQDSIVKKLSRFLGDSGTAIGDHTYERVTKKIRDKYFIDETYDSIHNIIKLKISESDSKEATRLYYNRLLTSNKLTTNERIDKSNLLNEAVRKSSKITRENFFDYKDNPLRVTNIEKYVPFFNFSYNNLKIIKSNPNAWLSTFALLNVMQQNLQPVEYNLDEDQFKGYFETWGVGAKLLWLMWFWSMGIDAGRLSPVALGMSVRWYPYHKLMMPTQDRDYQMYLDGDIKFGAAWYVLKKTIPVLYDLVAWDTKTAMSRLMYMWSGMPVKDNSLKEFMSAYYSGNYKDASNFNQITLNKYNEWRKSHDPDAPDVTKKTIKALAKLDEVMERGDDVDDNYKMKKMFPDLALAELGYKIEDIEPDVLDRWSHALEQVYDKYVDPKLASDFDSDAHLAKLTKLNSDGVFKELIKADVMKGFAEKSLYKVKNQEMLSTYYYDTWDTILSVKPGDTWLNSQLSVTSLNERNVSCLMLLSVVYLARLTSLSLMCLVKRDTLKERFLLLLMVSLLDLLMFHWIS